MAEATKNPMAVEDAPSIVSVITGEDIWNTMGRIIVQTEISNPADESKSIKCSMLVDTVAGLILPASWKDRLGKFSSTENVELILANNEVLKGEACGPAGIKIERFRRIYNEVIFMEIKTGNMSRC